MKASIIFLLFLQIILCIEKKSKSKMLSRSSLQKPLKQDDGWKDEENQYKKKTVDALIKCVYIDDYIKYDLSPLTKSDKDGVYDYNTTLNGQDIVFNFCKNINKKTCTNLNNKQVASYFLPNKCNPLVDNKDKGAKWTILKNKNDTTESITINLPQDPSSSKKVTFKLKCDLDEKKYKDNKLEIIDDENYEDENGIFLSFKTYYACGKLHYRVWKFIEDHYIIFSIILIILGLIITFLGQKFIVVTIYIVVTAFVVFLAFIILAFSVTENTKNWVIWLVLAIALVLGVVLSFFVAKYKEKVLGILFGVIGGFFVGQLIFNACSRKITWHPQVVNFLIILGGIIIMVILGLLFVKYMIIICTSIIGAYLTVRGVSMLIGYFPNDYAIIDLGKADEEDQIKKLVTWKFYLYLAVIAILAGLGIFVQILLKKREDAKEKKKKETRLMNADEEGQALLK